MKPTIEEIEQAIRAVAAAESQRYFKSEVNTPGRSSYVVMVILSEIALALFDLGLDFEQVQDEADPTGTVLAQMMQDGYKLSIQQLREGFNV